MKKYILLTLSIVIILFILLWFIDTLLPNYSPDYNPLLQFLRLVVPVFTGLIGGGMTV